MADKSIQERLMNKGVNQDKGRIEVLRRDHRNPDNLVWYCRECGHKIGRVTDKSNVVRVKHKDLFIAIWGEDVYVKTNCLMCGSENTLKPKKKWKLLIRRSQDGV